jgi:hypothetical protein
MTTQWRWSLLVICGRRRVMEVGIGVWRAEGNFNEKKNGEMKPLRNSQAELGNSWISWRCSWSRSNTSTAREFFQHWSKLSGLSLSVGSSLYFHWIEINHGQTHGISSTDHNIVVKSINLAWHAKFPSLQRRVTILARNPRKQGLRKAVLRA